MDRGAWRTAFHGSDRVGHSVVVTKPPPHPTGKSESEVLPPSVFRQPSGPSVHLWDRES